MISRTKEQSLGQVKGKVIRVVNGLCAPCNVALVRGNRQADAVAEKHRASVFEHLLEKEFQH